MYVKVGRELTDLELNFDPFCSISVQYYYISVYQILQTCLKNSINWYLKLDDQKIIFQKSLFSKLIAQFSEFRKSQQRSKSSLLLLFLLEKTYEKELHLLTEKSMALVVREEVLYVVVELIVILFKKLNKQFASVFTQASLDAKCKGITIQVCLQQYWHTQFQIQSEMW